MHTRLALCFLLAACDGTSPPVGSPDEEDAAPIRDAAAAATDASRDASRALDAGRPSEDAHVDEPPTADASVADATVTDASIATPDAATPEHTYPAPSSRHLAVGAHDPALIRQGERYYLFATGGKLDIRASSDLDKWARSATIFDSLPGWIASALGQNIDGLWAPDVSFFSGSYHVYYSGSTFGSNHSVIGLATNGTLDPASKDYRWVDQGLVLESNKAGGAKDDWNAIDPNLSIDREGQPWLVFGSFWSGIKLRKVDVSTGKLSTSDTKLYALANYQPGIEAPSIVEHGGYYYLFVSFDKCCAGKDSTYRTMVGRASAITGPYADRAGKAMSQGNAEQLLAGQGRYLGPGGGTAFQDGTQYFYVHHYYDGQANGEPLLLMRPITWTDDWPVMGTPLWQ